MNIVNYSGEAYCREISHYYDEKSFLECLKNTTLFNKLYSLTEEGHVHGIVWFDDKYESDITNAEFLPQYKWYCEEDQDWYEGAYIKFSDGAMIQVLTNQAEAERLIRQLHDKLHGSAERRAIRKNMFENLFPEVYQQFAAEAYDSASKDNDDGTTTYLLYNEYYDILQTKVD